MNNAQSFKWTEERIATLSQSWADGKSATAVGKELGVSRSSVIGKVHRLNLPKPSGKIRVARPRAAPTERRMRRRLNSSMRIKAEPVAPPVDTSNAVTFMALKFHHCRYVLGDPNGAQTLYCGAVRHELQSYCLAHHRMTHQRLGAKPIPLGVRLVLLRQLRRAKAAKLMENAA